MIRYVVERNHSGYTGKWTGGDMSRGEWQPELGWWQWKLRHCSIGIERRVDSPGQLVGSVNREEQRMIHIGD